MDDGALLSYSDTFALHQAYTFVHHNLPVPVSLFIYFPLTFHCLK